MTAARARPRGHRGGFEHTDGLRLAIQPHPGLEQPADSGRERGERDWVHGRRCTDHPERACCHVLHQQSSAGPGGRVLAVGLRCWYL